MHLALALFIMYIDIDLITEIMVKKLKFLGHVNSMDPNKMTKIYFDNRSNYKRHNERFRLTWIDGVQKYLNHVEISSWRPRTSDWTIYKSELRELRSMTIELLMNMGSVPS